MDDSPVKDVMCEPREHKRCVDRLVSAISTLNGSLEQETVLTTVLEEALSAEFGWIKRCS
ncbi:MAG: hypothetical protein HN742_13185 [Lentisphaerae bacterium]|jgi:hypothetical protein|nr:hypothetical protein [Lentisphaerota bacterium]MBT4820302.1 hypothetical protein [Lentisphaerota bacterium]MBT5604771.1 hypothetical protein [Lentisphaerota bacterium]MBT7053903.1 hypothetical protein [Lentisphaerota bacterium]MBT7842825.1 hypothetical protein [Lentisphaerota bacterium]